MAHTPDKRMNARERAAARREQLRQQHTPPPPHHARPRHVRERLHAAYHPGGAGAHDEPRRPRRSRRREQPPHTTSPMQGAQGAMRASVAAVGDAVRNGRAQVQRARAAAAQRRTAGTTHTPPPASTVRPTTRRLFAGWLQSGRTVSLLVLLACVGTLVYLFESPDLTVQAVTVQGNDLLAGDRLVELASVSGESIWFADTAAASERLKTNAYVEHAAVHLSLPNTATLYISERQPDVRWQVGTTQYLIDAGGVVLDVATDPAPPGTLVIVANPTANLPPLEPNQHIDYNALELARALSLRVPFEVGIEPQQIGWDIALGVYIVSPWNQTIVFGSTANLDRKLAVLKYLLDNGTTFTYLDLRPNNPYYRP